MRPRLTCVMTGERWFLPLTRMLIIGPVCTPSGYGSLRGVTLSFELSRVTYLPRRILVGVVLLRITPLGCRELVSLLGLTRVRTFLRMCSCLAWRRRGQYLMVIRGRSLSLLSSLSHRSGYGYLTLCLLRALGNVMAMPCLLLIRN